MGDKNQTPQLGRCSSVPRINAAESSLKTRRIYRPEIWCYQPLRGIWFRLQLFTALVTSCAASAVRGRSCASLQTGHEHDEQDERRLEGFGLMSKAGHASMCVIHSGT